MKAPDRQLYKLALFILEQLSEQAGRQPERIAGRLANVRETSACLAASGRRLEACFARGWRTAAQTQHEQLAELARELASRVSELQAVCHAEPPADPPGLRDILGDLLQLEEEFDGAQLDLKTRQVSISIEPVTLNDVYLGPFKVELDLDSLSGAAGELPYRVIALDPHPASTNEAVTHPHVRDEELCEGDAKAGIRAALRTGRLCDFFILIRSVLQTYNPHSPYVALESWEGGVSCDDCGYVCGEGDSRYCDSCNRDYCEDCMSYCRQCDESRCRGCLKTCDACEESVCCGCGTPCGGCKKFVCSGCLEDDLCPACREKEETSDGTPKEIFVPVPCIGGSRRQRRRLRHRNIAA